MIVTVDIMCPSCFEEYCPSVNPDVKNEIVCSECGCNFSFDVDVEITAFNITTEDFIE